MLSPTTCSMTSQPSLSHHCPTHHSSTQHPPKPQTQNIFTTPASRWTALTSRLPAAHTAFVYAVRSTLIYCRPTCYARLARRANVTFYNKAAQAAAAGYRPCRRCRPEVESWEGDAERVVGRCRGVILGRVKKGKTGDDGGLSVKELSAAVGVSPSYLCRVVKAKTGVTLKVWVNGIRAEVEARAQIQAQTLGPEEQGVLSGAQESCEELVCGDPLVRDTPTLTTSAGSTPGVEGVEDMGGVDWDAFLHTDRFAETGLDVDGVYFEGGNFTMPEGFGFEMEMAKSTY